MDWLFIVALALIMGGVIDIYDNERRNSAFALALLFAVIVGAAYAFFLYLRMFLP